MSLLTDLVLVKLMCRAMVAEMDEEKDSTINYTEIKAEPLGEIKF